MGISIVSFRKHPKMLSQLEHIFYEFLAKPFIPGFTQQDVHDELLLSLEQELNPDRSSFDRVKDKFADTYVAIDDASKEPVAMCTLMHFDGVRADLRPWFTSLVVNPDHQKKGIAKALLTHAEKETARLGYEKMHLFVLDPTLVPLYAHLGYTNRGIEQYEHDGRSNQPVTMMDKIVMPALSHYDTPAKLSDSLGQTVFSSLKDKKLSVDDTIAAVNGISLAN